MKKSYNNASLDIERGDYLLTAYSKDSEKKHTGLLRFWSFLLPILLLIPAFIYMGIFPFGQTTTMTIDLQHEYVGFYEGLRHALEAPEAFFYNSTKSIGGDMAGTFAYYLMSPLNLLFFLLPSDQMPMLIELVQLLKIGFAGFAFSCLLIRREHGQDFRVVIFSTLYALCAFIPANMLNQMWLDPIALFPLVVLYLENLLDGGNPLPYILLLALMIWTNFYIAYMGCIFLVFFAIYYLIRRPKGRRTAAMPSGIKAFFTFALASIVGAAITACLLVPTVYSLVLSKGAYSLDLAGRFTFIYPPLDFFVKLIPAAFNYDQVPNGLPNVFTGTLCTLGLIFFLTNGRIRFREKISALLVLAILYLSMVVDAPNIIWHGMQHPVWYNYRFSWLFSFFLALISYRAYLRMDHLSIPGTILSAIGAGGLAFYAYKHLDRFDFLIPANLIYFLAMVVMTLIVLHFCFQRDRQKRIRSMAVLSVLTFSELAFSAAVQISSFSYEELPNFQFFDQAMNEALAPIRPQLAQGQYWRIEKTFMHDNNDAMRFNYPGLSHFNSGLETRTIDLCSSLGFATTKNSLNGTNPTKFTDALFGIRYYLDSTDIGDASGKFYQFRPKSMRPDFQDMKRGASYDHIQVYENDKTMPICLLAEEGIKQLDPGRMNPLDFQDDLANLLDGHDGEINYFRRESVDLVAMKGLSQGVDADGLSRYDRLQPPPTDLQEDDDFQVPAQNDPLNPQDGLPAGASQAGARRMGLPHLASLLTPRPLWAAGLGEAPVVSTSASDASNGSAATSEDRVSFSEAVSHDSADSLDASEDLAASESIEEPIEEAPIELHEIPLGPNEKPSLDFRFKTQAGSSYYLSVSNTLNSKNSKLYLDQEAVPNKRTGSHVSSQVYNVSAAASPDASHDFRVEMTDDYSFFSVNNISLFALDERALQDAVSFQQTQGFQLKKMTDTRVEGLVEATEKTPYLVMTRPYDPGWTVTVDGREMEVNEVMGTLMAIRLTPGQHEVVWQYQPQGLKEGVWASLAGLALALAWGIGHQVKKSRRED